jgi:hypothetical protein
MLTAKGAGIPYHFFEGKSNKADIAGTDRDVFGPVSGVLSGSGPYNSIDKSLARGTV